MWYGHVFITHIYLLNTCIMQYLRVYQIPPGFHYVERILGNVWQWTLVLMRWQWVLTVIRIQQRVLQQRYVQFSRLCDMFLCSDIKIVTGNASKIYSQNISSYVAHVAWVYITMYNVNVISDDNWLFGLYHDV